MRVKLLVRWSGDDHANAGDVIDVDDSIALHHIARGNFEAVDAPAPAAMPESDAPPADEPTDSSDEVVSDDAETPAPVETPAPSRRRHR